MQSERVSVSTDSELQSTSAEIKSESLSFSCRVKWSRSAKLHYEAFDGTDAATFEKLESEDKPMSRPPFSFSLDG